jgi:hypothetical protein
MNLKLLCFLALLALLLLGPNAKAASDKADSVFLAGLHARIAGIRGWTEQKDRFRYFQTRLLYDIIDGGAVEYEKTGLVDGIVVDLGADSNRTVEIYIENFGRPAHARTMLAQKKKSANEPKQLDAPAVADAFYDEVIGGCMVYFCRDNYYFEMTLTGYDNPQQGMRDGKIFVNLCLKK